jgi:hypothetical protein
VLKRAIRSLWFLAVTSCLFTVTAEVAGSRDVWDLSDIEIWVRYGCNKIPTAHFEATAGNARNYYTQSAGFTLRFPFNPIPTSTGLHVNSIPDWTGKQPFAIR